MWPRGGITWKYNLPVDSLLKFEETGIAGEKQNVYKSPAHYFKNITANSGIDFTHKENDFIDFKSEVLLPWELSRYGPALAKADINNDGLDDFFVGGAIGQPGSHLPATGGWKIYQKNRMILKKIQRVRM